MRDAEAGLHGVGEGRRGELRRDGNDADAHVIPAKAVIQTEIISLSNRFRLVWASIFARIGNPI